MAESEALGWAAKGSSRPLGYIDTIKSPTISKKLTVCVLSLHFASAKQLNHSKTPDKQNITVKTLSERINLAIVTGNKKYDKRNVRRIRTGCFGKQNRTLAEKGSRKKNSRARGIWVQRNNSRWRLRVRVTCWRNRVECKTEEAGQKALSHGVGCSNWRALGLIYTVYV